VTARISLGRQAAREGKKLAVASAGMQTYLQAQGAHIVTSGTAPGFIDVYNPSYEELRAASYLPSYVTASTPFGGSLVFAVRRGAANDLMGLACDTSNITDRGQPSPVLTGQVLEASGGAGLTTNAATPGLLQGPAFQNIASPVNGAAIVCAWTLLPNPS
jgi:hypothetical protein